jgi:hypothetical protein
LGVPHPGGLIKKTDYVKTWTMKIRLTPPALVQLEWLAKTDSNQTGFITGLDLGRFRIIETLFPINFTPSDFDAVCEKTYSQIGNKMLGVFFYRCAPFFCDWLMENLIVQLDYPQIEFFLYDVNRRLKPLQKMTVNKEAK